MTNNQEPRHFEKRVTIAEKDDDERTATGAALVPDEVDHQRDFLRADGIKALFNDDPADGVMHAVFPSNSADLVRNETLTEPETIGGREYPAGTWVITRQYNDDQLYQLVSDGVLTGFSIGGSVTEAIEYAAGDLPGDVTFPAGVDGDGSVTEIVDGEVTEISDVDYPAVPNADYATVKSHALGKSVLDEVAGEGEFIELMVERGHSETDATRLWNFLTEHSDAMSPDTDDDKDEPTDETSKHDIESVDNETLGKRVKRFFFGSETDDGQQPEDSDTEAEAEKAGRTLSASNRQNAMAIHDAALTMLNASGADTGMRRRFTDDGGSSFDIAEYGKAAPDGGVETDKDAPDGDTSDEETMTEETDKALAEQNAERLDTIEEKLDKALGETEDEETEKSMDDAPEWAQAMNEKIDDNAEAIEAIGKQSGASTQLGDVESDESETELDAKTKLFAPAGMQEVN